MGTIMLYHSETSTLAKPDIVDFTIRMAKKAQTAKDAVTELNVSRALATDYIKGLKSYRPESFKQENIDLRKIVNRETYYEKGDSKISVKEYNKLPINERFLYEEKTIERFLGYTASLTISATLNKSDTVVEDLVNVFNMATEKEFVCTYKHSLSNEILEQYARQMFIDCVNHGYRQVEDACNFIDVLKGKPIKLIQIIDPEAVDTVSNDRDYGAVMKCASRTGIGSSYEPEQIMLPELIEGLFNNNIELTRSLDLKFDI